MAVNYLHGVETIELDKGPKPVREVKSAVIGLVGIAPKGPKNVLTVVKNEADASAFGSQLSGFNIPDALASIFDQGAGTIMVVNIFDATTHTTAVTDESLTITNGKAKTAAEPVADFVLTNVGGTTTYIEGTHYEIDDFGNIKVLDFATITEGSSVEADYKKLDPAAVVASELIGTYDAGTDARTGMQVFDAAYSLFGFTPRLLIAPGYSELDAIAAEMLVKAAKYRGHAILDAPEGTVVADAITGRGPSGSINFDTSSERAILCYPHLKAYDPSSDSVVNKPYSQFLAGLIARVDNEEGYHVSPSNHEIRGITGVERTITAAINDASTDANALNEVGIVTTFNSFGSGIRAWGNRSAAFPSSTSPDNFIPVRRTADIIHESVELAMLQFIDKPINNAVIDSIRGTVNGFLKSLQSRGAIIGGECTFDPAKNPVTSLSAGKLIFDINFMPPTPAERITFESYIDVNLLNALLG